MLSSKNLYFINYLKCNKKISIMYAKGENMIKIYGSPLCPDCVECKANFDKYNIEYEYIDINASLKNLKEFLIYRDNEPIFNHLKAIHDIGIPACIDEDGTVFTDWDNYVRKLGFEPFFQIREGEACSIDGRGC